MQFLERIFGSIDRTYLIRAYGIGCALFALLVYLDFKFLHPGIFPPVSILCLFSLNTLLFPFSKIGWDQAKSVVLGTNRFAVPAIILLPVKLFINYMLWGYAVFIAPIAILWLLYRTRTSV